MIKPEIYYFVNLMSVPALSLSKKNIKRYFGKVLMKVGKTFMGKIGELIEEAWSNLLKDCINKVFHPKNEYDIQAHLYHYLWTKLRKFNKKLIIRVAYTFKRKHIDFVVLKKGKKREQPILAVEIKEYGPRSKGQVPENILYDKLKEDLDKLRAFRNQKGPLTYICLFFRYELDVKNPLVKNRLKDAKKHCKEVYTTLLWGSFNKQEELVKLDPWMKKALYKL